MEVSLCFTGSFNVKVTASIEKRIATKRHQTMNRPLFIPVILGTVRKGRATENIAKFVFEQVKKREGVETELIDILELKFPADDAGEQIKHPKFSATCARAD